MHIIDVRSPAEFAEDHIPGAISAPVLDDEERAKVGTLYKQVSAFDAKKLGAALLAKNFARHVENLFKDKEQTWRPLVYCWRGGKRSGAVAHILREIGWSADTLEGGYKAYRRWVVQQLEEIPQQLEWRVIHGPTGSGKSRLLSALNAAGAPGARPGGPRRASRLGARQPSRPAAALAEDVRKPASSENLRPSN